MKIALAALFLLSVPLLAIAADEPLAILQVDKLERALLVKVQPRDSLKWSEEYPAKLFVTSINPWVKTEQIFERSRFTSKDFEEMEGLTQVHIPMKSVDPALLVDAVILVKIKFAVCNKTSCYPQKAELIVRF